MMTWSAFSLLNTRVLHQTPPKSPSVQVSEEHYFILLHAKVSVMMVSFFLSLSVFCGELYPWVLPLQLGPLTFTARLGS